MFCKFLHENKVYRKNGVHHDEANGKSFETVISIFLFVKLCHKNFSSQSNVKNHDFIEIMIFNITLWRKISVTKFQKYKIWDDSFEGFSAGFVVVYSIFSVDFVFMEKFAKQNGCKMDAALNRNKKCPFCFPNSSQKTCSAEKMEYTTTKPTKNSLKLSSQIFYFWNFVTENFRPKVMLKIMISSKNWYKFLFFRVTIYSYLIN